MCSSDLTPPYSPRTSNHLISGCTANQIGSGDATVNANAFILLGADGIIFSNNKATQFERNMVKIDDCTGFKVLGNMATANTLGGFGAYATQHGATDGQFIGNSASVTGAGITLNQAASSDGPTQRIIITGNTINNAVDSTGGGNCISVSSGFLLSTEITISNNDVSNCYRQGIYLVGIFTQVIVNGNTATRCGLAGVAFTASGGSIDELTVSSNTIDVSANSTAQAFIFARTSSNTFTNLNMQNNYAKGGASTAAIYDSGVADYISGVMANNAANFILWSQGGCIAYNNIVPNLGNSGGSSITTQYRVLLTTPTTLNAADSTVLVKLTSPGAVSITLPTGAYTGRPIYIKDATGDAGTNTVTINRSGSSTFEDGSTTQTITTNFGYITVAWRSNTDNKWYIVNRG